MARELDEKGMAWLEEQIDLTHPDYGPRFTKNVLNARGEGFELCCVYCGVGVYATRNVPFDAEGGQHELWCPCAGEGANEDAAASREP